MSRVNGSDVKRVLCLTTSRADFGLLRWPMRALADAGDFDLKLVASGGHLAASQGETVSEIIESGFEIAARIPVYAETGAASDAAVGLGQSAQAVAGVIARLAPDWVLLLGDRFEVLGAVAAAAAMRVPICHLCGGDVTEGAYDDAFRHAITKLAHLHCPSTEEAAARIRQMGEEAWRVHVTGSPGLDALERVPRFGRAEVMDRLGLRGGGRLVLVTQHPETLAADCGLGALRALLAVLRADPTLEVVFTGSNADTGGAAFRAEIEAFCDGTGRAMHRASLGQTLYLNVARIADAVVGNSSSGLYEVPSLGTPSVNIGDRQKGRLRAASVFDCVGTESAIRAALDAAFAFGKKAVPNPYGDGKASARIVEALRFAGSRGDDILRKKFVCSWLDGYREREDHLHR